MTEPLIRLQDLRVCLGRREILKGLTVGVGGRAIGLLGPNGAGKTTLIHTLLGFFPITSGSASVLGYDVARQVGQVRGRIGYMPENESFIGHLSAVAFLRLMGEISGLPPRAALERSHEALHYVGLGEARYRTLSTYSLGMRQRVKLAQALVHGPELLFLDEPTNGLDPPGRQRMLALIGEIATRGGIRIVLSSHLLHDVEQICDEVLVLKDGRIATYCNLEQERQANRKFVEVEIRGGNGAFTESLSRLGCQCAKLRRGRIKMVLPENVEVRDIYRAAAEAEVQVRRLDFKRDSLEDIFLKAMEGGHDGGL